MKAMTLCEEWTNWWDSIYDKLLTDTVVSGKVEEAFDTLISNPRTIELSRLLARVDLQPPFVEFVQQYYNATRDDILRQVVEEMSNTTSSDDVLRALGQNTTLIPEAYADNHGTMMLRYYAQIIYKVVAVRVTKKAIDLTHRLLASHLRRQLKTSTRRSRSLSRAKPICKSQEVWWSSSSTVH